MSRAILILSEGKSSRMGVDKASLKIDGLTLLSYQVDCFRAHGWPVVSALKDTRPGYLGPLAGIESALLQCPTIGEWLIVPVDMPLLSICSCELLFSEGARYGCATAFEKKPLPLYLPRSVAAIELLSDWLASDTQPRSVYAFMSTLQGKWCRPPINERELNNYNTPEQWAELFEDNRN